MTCMNEEDKAKIMDKPLGQGSPNLILEGQCPAEFSSNLPQLTSREVLSIPKTLISCFRCV